MDYRLLHAKTVAELRAMAREEKIKIPTGASKARIVELLLEVENQRAAELAQRQAEAQRAAEQKLAQRQSPAQAETEPEPPKKRRGRPPKPKAEPIEAAETKAEEAPRRRGRPPKKLSAPAPEQTDAAPAKEPDSPLPAENAPLAGRSEPAARAEFDHSEPAAQPTPPKAEPAVAADAQAELTNAGSAADPAAVMQKTIADPAPHADNRKSVADPTPQAEMQKNVADQAAEMRKNIADPTPHAEMQKNVADQAAGMRDPVSDQAPSAGAEPVQPAPARKPDASDQPRCAESTPRFDPARRYPAQPVRRPYDPAQRPAPPAERHPRRPDAVSGSDGRFVPRNDTNPSVPQAERHLRRPDTVSGSDGRFAPRNDTNPSVPQAERYPRRPDAVSGSDGRFVPRNDTNPSAPQREEPSPRYVRREYVPQDPNDVTQAVSDLLAAGDCAVGGGVLEPMPDGYGFLRAENYQQGPRDVYVSAAQIRRFDLRTGDLVVGRTRPQREGDRYTGLIFIDTVNGDKPERAMRRPRFEDLTPVYPQRRIRLEGAPGRSDMALRVIDLLAPIGRGQRALIVSQPKAGKTVLLKKIANAITENEPDIELIVLLIDERPEEVTDMQRSIRGDVVYSTFDEMPENHARVAEMVLERAQRLVEQGKDVVILLDSITRLARAYNLVIPPTGRTLSGGLDPGALHKPKRFFGAARNIENGGSLTIIATALVETGSRMDDIIFEEFKGTGNSEIHLDRKLSEKRIFPAIDMNKSGTRRDDLLLTPDEAEGALAVRRMLSSGPNQDAVEQLMSMLHKTPSNAEFFRVLKSLFLQNQKDGFSYGGR